MYGRLAIAKAIGGLNRRNAVPPSGRPAQHLSPITSYARFESVLRALKFASGYASAEIAGFARIEDVLRALKMASGYASAASRNLIFDN